MRVQDQASPVEIVGLGIALVAGGVYFILVAMGVLPEPSGNLARAPSAIFYAIGFSFLFAGLICFLRAKTGMTGEQDGVSESAPDWLKSSYRALAIGVAGSLALVGTWVAIGSGSRAFTVASPAGEMQTTGELIGRAVFALGTVIVWIYVIALTVQTVRRLFRRRTG